jgi:hypothetical protein
MKLRRVRFSTAAILVAISAAVTPAALLRAGPGLTIRTNEEAVEAAATLGMRGDAAFRPEEHRARVFRECGMAALLVDFYPVGADRVVKRVGFTARGAFRGPSTYTRAEGVKSFRDGPGLYLLDRAGRVTGPVPQ